MFRFKVLLTATVVAVGWGASVAIGTSVATGAAVAAGAEVAGGVQLANIVPAVVKPAAFRNFRRVSLLFDIF